MPFSISLFSRPASKAGALPANGFRCSCGTEQATSLSEREAKNLAAAHLAYHARREA